ncbi:hypothetical protein [Roseateles puraquae]|uniref:Uncharacterized protein n=1 Tax=Roseateles puraquae TaxID=431059 RepID=A0A254NC17_9BURK|nr:hypothetical protein [Roseateles puraquae]MDG0853370.1 hypothetical protein [Roseateles puraquae]OWR02948.1 hypothetical protein CDO81_15285 [Roseateles puraquae]
MPEYAVLPPPLLTVARLVDPPVSDGMPLHTATWPMGWVFREQSFDSVTRVRRGLLYEPFPGGQPRACLTRGHPSQTLYNPRQGESLTKTLFWFWPCQSLLRQPRGGEGLTLALGKDESRSSWRIVQVERVVGDDVLVTLKVLSAFGVLPDLKIGAVPAEHLESVRRALDRVLDSAFREGPTSVVDQCRNAAVVLLGRWMAATGNDAKLMELDLGALVRKIREVPFGLAAVAGVAEMINRLHPRGKANEQESKGWRLAQEEDGEAAVHAIGFILREIGWAM